MVGGLSLGAATALGAALGAGWATLRRYQNELKAAFQGHRWLCADDNTVSLLYLRQETLLRTLTHRGHAAQGRIQLSDNAEHALPKHWDRIIKTLRQNPEWQHHSSTGTEYRQLQTEVTGWLTGDGE